MANSRKLVVEIIGDTSSLEKAFGRVEKKSSAFSRSMKVGATAALGGLALAARAGFNELQAMQQVNAQTAAALKSTGGVANVTAKQIDELSQSILTQTGIDDEAVKASENMLLTFTNVRNEVGKGNDIFNQATQAVADMATRMNNGAIPSAEQLSTTSIRLGKALNDPIKGIGALSRVGVQFTASQKEAIKAMVATGDTMGAQKLILAELNKEFGGSAKAAGDTLPGQLAKSREAFNNMTAELVTALLPAMLALSKIVTQLSQFFQKHSTIAKVLASTIAALAVTVLATSAAFKVYTAGARIAAASNFLFGRSAVSAAAGANAARLSLVGKAGLVGAVGLLSFGLTTAILRLTGLDKKLAGVGGRARDLTDSLGITSDPGAQFSGRASGSNDFRFIRNRLKRLQAGGMTPSQSVSAFAASHPGAATSDLNALSVRSGGKPLVVQANLYVDGKRMATNTTNHQLRGKNRNPAQKRGPLAQGT